MCFCRLHGHSRQPSAGPVTPAPAAVPQHTPERPSSVAWPLHPFCLALQAAGGCCAGAEGDPRPHRASPGRHKAVDRGIQRAAAVRGGLVLCQASWGRGRTGTSRGSPPVQASGMPLGCVLQTRQLCRVVFHSIVSAQTLASSSIKTIPCMHINCGGVCWLSGLAHCGRVPPHLEGRVVVGAVSGDWGGVARPQAHISGCSAQHRQGGLSVAGQGTAGSRQAGAPESSATAAAAAWSRRLGAGGLEPAVGLSGGSGWSPTLLCSPAARCR